MATVAFTELLPEVLAVAPTAPVPTIVRNIRNAARDLCERAKIYRYTVEDEAVYAGLAEVELTLPDYTSLVTPISLTLAGEPMTPSSPILLDEEAPDWRTETGIPKHFIRSTDQLNSLILYPIPETAYTSPGLNGVVSLKPSRTATVIDEVILDRYQTALISGALSRLLMIHGTLWYNPAQAAYHAGVFVDAVDRAQRAANGDDMPKRRLIRYGGI